MKKPKETSKERMKRLLDAGIPLTPDQDVRDKMASNQRAYRKRHGITK